MRVPRATVVKLVTAMATARAVVTAVTPVRYLVA
jgi:hypothetical protein